jgi:hypothetical protein
LNTLKALPEINPRQPSSTLGFPPANDAPTVTERIALARRDRHDTAIEELVIELVNIRNEVIFPSFRLFMCSWSQESAPCSCELVIS